MEISTVGLLVVAAIFAFVYFLRGSLIGALMVSIAFGSTSFATLPSIGGSSPQIYSLFALLLVISVAARRQFVEELGTAYALSSTPWIVTGLMIYAAASAYIFPRLFSGQATVFVTSRFRGGVFEAPLEPVSGNISQTAYLILSGMVFIALLIVLMRRTRMEDIRRSFFYWVITHTTLGVIDFSGKLAGLGDILYPIRTANYALATQASEAGFWRIAGGQSEASSFGSMSLACLAFTYTYWRKTGTSSSLYLSLALLALLIASTSSTAYAGLALMGTPVLIAVAYSLISNRLVSAQALVIGLCATCVLLVMIAAIMSPALYNSILHLIDRTLINKLDTSSGQERAYWNYKSLQAFIDTATLGVGMGSSRASSWLIAVVSQLGLIGSFLMAALILPIARPLKRDYYRSENSESEALVSSVRMCAIASLVSASLISGTPDPGLIFFVSLAVICAYRTVANSPIGTQPRRRPDLTPAAITGPANVRRALPD